ncbi:MAG: phosphopyruvate hydratase [Bdellovibrionales bacterium]
MKIARIAAREILDSRGTPTVEVDCWLEGGAFGRAAVPSGASTGAHEAIEKRDGEKTRFGGKGVRKVCAELVQEIQPLLANDFGSQTQLDEALVALDGTENKSRLGANAVLAVSLAFAKATAAQRGQPFFASLGGAAATRMPLPLMNIINGGAHANNGLAIQEFMIAPVGATRFSEALRCGVEVFQALKAGLKQNGMSIAVGDEGGFAPMIDKTRTALDGIMLAIRQAGYIPGEDVAVALDVAASEVYRNGRYTIDGEDFSSDELVDFYASLANDYPLVSIEDGMAEDDWDGWRELTAALGDRLQLVGDDLFVTNTARLQQGIDEGSANAILIKPNQIGTLTETLEAISLAQKNNYGVVLSHRSGETEDTSIADIAVATNAGQIKTGSLSRTDRTAKYNQLLRIEETLGPAAVFKSPLKWRKT